MCIVQKVWVVLNLERIDAFMQLLDPWSSLGDILVNFHSKTQIRFFQNLSPHPLNMFMSDKAVAFFVPAFTKKTLLVFQLIIVNSISTQCTINSLFISVKTAVVAQNN